MENGLAPRSSPLIQILLYLDLDLQETKLQSEDSPRLVRYSVLEERQAGA